MMDPSSSSRHTWKAVLLLLLIAFSDSKQPETDNKFRQRQATDDSLPFPNIDEETLANTNCPQFAELRWQTEVSSSIYATPLIEDINSDGKLEVVIPSFVHQLEVLDGSDGEKVPGWPASHQSTVHSSPLMYDIDNDGAREIALGTYNGEVLFFRSSGHLMAEKLVIPRLRVRKKLYTSSQDDQASQSVHDDVMAAQNMGNVTTTEQNGQSQPSSNKETGTPNLVTKDDSDSTNSRMVNQDSMKLDNEKFEKMGANVTNSQKVIDSIPSDHSEVLNMNTRVHSVVKNDEVLGTGLEIAAATNNSDNKNESLLKRSQKRRLLENIESAGQETSKSTDVRENVTTVENDQGPLEEAADSSFDVFRDEEENMEDGLTDEYKYDYDDYVDDAMWGDENWKENLHEKEEDFINIDAHILCTPVVADIDKDGIYEMIVATSYFFDPEYYSRPETAAELGQVDFSTYVAAGIVVFNLDTKQVKWHISLDQTTDRGVYRSYIYSSPTLVDLDNDGFLDIIVGTSYGFFYVVDHQGQTRENFPLLMGEIQGQILAADINDDGKVEIVTADTRGNVAAWTSKGKELWEVHLKSIIAQSPIAGDVDGDGHTDIVIPTFSGNIYVLKGVDGTHVHPFPYRTRGRVMAPVLLMDLNQAGEGRKGLTLITTCFDGYLYFIDGQTACSDAVDIGETSYSMVLADNVDGGDDLDLVVTTMNGNVFCFSTPVPYNLLKTWPSHNQGRNLLSVRYNHEGIFVLPSSRSFRDEEGDSFWIHFNIVDQQRFSSGPYNVTATLLLPGNYLGPRRITKSQILDKVGIHQFKMPCVPVRTTGMVILEMVDRNGLYFVDSFALTFHMHYYRLLKWLTLIPMLAMFGIILLFQPEEGVSLPSFSTDRHQL